MSIVLGSIAEVTAREYLVQQGLKWVESNYRCRFGEIDLIMQEGAFLVFVEVRSRKTERYGGAIASITYQKQQKIIKTALLYLQYHRLQDKVPVRFDVVSVVGSQVTWIRDAMTG